MSQTTGYGEVNSLVGPTLLRVKYFRRKKDGKRKNKQKAMGAQWDNFALRLEGEYPPVYAERKGGWGFEKKSRN